MYYRNSSYLLRFVSLAVAAVVCAGPAAAREQPEGGTMLFGFGTAVVLALSLCGIFAVFFSDYTRQTTELALADIGPVLKSGFALTAALLVPFLAAGVANLVLEEPGVAYLAVFGILGPLLVVPVAGSGLGFLVLARAVTGHWLAATAVVALVAGGIGAGMTVFPTLLLAVLPLAAAGIGAMLHQWRRPSASESGERRKTDPWQHRHR